MLSYAIQIVPTVELVARLLDSVERPPPIAALAANLSSANAMANQPLLLLTVPDGLLAI